MFRFIDRHLSLVIVISFSLVAWMLENRFMISGAFVEMAQSGTLMGLSATLVGFLVTGLTILLAFGDKPSLTELAKTRAYRYVHRSFVYAIWLQVTLLVFSLVLEVIFRRGYCLWPWAGSLLLYVTVISMSLLLVCVYYLSIMVTAAIGRSQT